MKLIIIKILNKVLGFINKVYKPKRKHTKEELKKELDTLLRNNIKK